MIETGDRLNRFHCLNLEIDNLVVTVKRRVRETLELNFIGSLKQLLYVGEIDIINRTGDR